MSIRTDDLAVIVRSSSGAELHLSTTSDDPELLVTIHSITTKLGTGYESASFSLNRDPLKRYDDLGLLQEVVIEGVDGMVLFEGAITGTAPESGQGLQVTATGHFSKLKDKSGFSQVYRDADMSHWGEQTLARRTHLAGAPNNIDLGQFGWSQDTGLIMNLPQQSLNASTRSSGGFYQAPAGTKIAKLEYNGSLKDWPGAWATYLAAGDDDTAAFTDQGLTVNGNDQTLTLTTARRFVELFALTSGTVTPAAGAYWKFALTALVGDHGLTSITPSTVLRHLIDTYGQGLRYDADSITDHPYEIGQLVFDAVTGADVVAKINAFANWNLNVWEGGFVHYGPAPDLNDPDYILDIEDGDERDPDGQSVSEDFPVNGVEGFYNDVLTGRDERIGPDDDYRLRSDDDENPCNKENRPRWGKLDISFASTEDDTIQICSVWLAEHLIPSRSGSGKATGTVIARNGQRVPAANIRAGEVIRYADEEIGRQVYGTSYQPTTQENALTFDDATATLDAILERIGIAISLVGSR